MTNPAPRSRLFAPLLLLAGLFAACGGKTSDGSGGSTGDLTSKDGSVDTKAGDDAGAGCVDVAIVSPTDTSCSTDDDCTLVRAGDVCNGQCSCGDTPVNAAAAARAQAETASLTLEGCPCAFPGTPRCLGGQCTLCDLGANQPAGCVDAGTTTTTQCVDIDLSTYDRSCTQPSDCIIIQTGEVCSGSCACGGSPVNMSEQARYDAATSGITFDACPCPAEFPPTCVNNLCQAGTPP